MEGGVRVFATLARSGLVVSNAMRILRRRTPIREIVAGLLVASVLVAAAACGGDESRYGGEKSGAFQPRSGVSWGN